MSFILSQEPRRVSHPLKCNILKFGFEMHIFCYIIYDDNLQTSYQISEPLWLVSAIYLAADCLYANIDFIII